MSIAGVGAEEFATLDRLLAGALELEPAAREDWLRAQCGANGERLQRILELVRRAGCAPDWEQRLAAEPMREFMAAAIESGVDDPVPSPERCGAWRLLKPIGRGGMADVHLGERSEPGFVQRAAIKVLAAPARFGEAIARFGQERRILASLDDPRIARLLDGGVLDDGRPWLAMEFVDGERIDAWCDARRLDVVARVRLLREVAAAVHSAHRALVVHRDIKPANVMVTGAGHVKLLDFGIAKLLASDGEDAGAQATHTQSRALTPQYASPEQLLGENVTTAADVYQLGLLMVELLAGVRPFHAHAGNLVDLAHAVVNEDAPAPSVALAKSSLPASETEAIAHARRSTASRLRRQLRGDLDAIAQRALARQPNQRYASAQQLAEDLDAWIEQRPVRARAPSLAYRLHRFASRNRVASSAGALLVLVLVAYVGTVLVQSERIRQESERNRQVGDFLVELLREADPRYTLTPRPSAARVMEQGLVRARERFADQPELLAQLLAMGAEVQIGRGHMESAAELMGEVVALRTKLDPDDPRLTGGLGELGRTLHYSARYAEAETTLRDAVERWYAQGARGTARIPMSLADVLHSRGEYAEAERVLRRADVAQRERNEPPLSHALLARDLGIVLRDAGRGDEARRLLESALVEFARVPGDNRLDIAATRTALARTYALAGDAARARTEIEAAIATQERSYGEHHSVVGMSRQTLALAAELDGDSEGAAQVMDVVISSDYANVAKGNVLIAYAQLDRAWMRLALGRDDDAARDLDLAEPVLLGMRPGGHPRWSEAQLARAVLARHRGDEAGALAAIDRAIAQRESVFGVAHEATIEARRWREIAAGRDATPPASGESRLEVHRSRLLEAARRPVVPDSGPAWSRREPHPDRSDRWTRETGSRSIGERRAPGAQRNAGHGGTLRGDRVAGLRLGGTGNAADAIRRDDASGPAAPGGRGRARHRGSGAAAAGDDRPHRPVRGRRPRHPGRRARWEALRA